MFVIDLSFLKSLSFLRLLRLFNPILIVGGLFLLYAYDKAYQLGRDIGDADALIVMNKTKMELI